MSEKNMLALCGVRSKPNEVTQILQQFEKANYPIIAPGGTTQCLTVAPGYAVNITSATFSKEDTYKMDGALCLKAPALRVLARGLGISWNACDMRRLDDQRDPHYCSMVVGGTYRDYTGELITITGSRTVDLRDGAPEAELALKNNKPSQLDRARMNIAQICETKAKNRAIADACVSRTIRPEDIGEAFIMAKVYRAAPIDDAQATEALYGRQEPEESDEPRRVEAEVRTTKREPQNPITLEEDGSFFLPGWQWLPEGAKGVKSSELDGEVLGQVISQLEGVLGRKGVPDAQRKVLEFMRQGLVVERTRRSQDAEFDFDSIPEGGAE